MEAPSPQGLANPRDSACGRGRAGFSPGSLAPAPGPPPRERLDLESQVREKVLFLLDPQRGLRAAGDPDEDTWEPSRAALDGLAPHRPPRGARRTPGPRISFPPGWPPRGPSAPSRSLLVRVEDYRVAREVLRTAWAWGQATTSTEERALSTVTFHASRD